MAEVYLGVGRTEYLVVPRTTVAMHASEISQAFEGLQLNSTAATLEHILAWLARFETRLVEHERRVAATLPPLCSVPDPPNRPPLYASVQPQFQSICHQPSSPTYSGLDQHVYRRFPEADYQPWQQEYQPLRPLPLPDCSLHLINRGLDSHSQPRNSHAEYRQLQQEYQPLRPIPPPPPQSHSCSAAPLLAAAPPPPPAPMIPSCSSDRIHTLSTMPQRVAAAVPPPPAAISPSCQVMSSALVEEIETTNLVEVKPGLRVKASQLKPEITQTEQTIPQAMGMIDHLNRKTLMSSH